MADQKRPASTRLPAPASLRAATEVPKDLAATFGPPGYLVALDAGELIVTRSGKMSLANDPDALPQLLDQPFGDQELLNLHGLVAAWEAGRAA